MIPGTPFSITLTTCPNPVVARELAKSLVEADLAACVNILPGLTSIYKWQGKIEESAETMLVIKAVSRLASRIAEFIEANHPYDCPEVVSLAVDEISEQYAKWLSESCDQLS